MRKGFSGLKRELNGPRNIRSAETRRWAREADTRVPVRRWVVRAHREVEERQVARRQRQINQRH